MSAPKGNDYAIGNQGGGRPSMYKEDYADQAYKLCLLGHTDEELAKFFEVSETTINNWKKEHKEFYLALKKGKEVADVEVVMALRKRALGMKLTKQVLKDGEIYELEDEIAPDPTSMIFWLKNRQPKIWRDKQETEHSGRVEVTSLGSLIDELSEDES